MIIYNGKSKIDGKPIVAIVTGLQRKSNNPKTGNIPQVWIMRSDIAPNIAVHTGDDYSICGNCKHRGVIVDGKNTKRPCYVTVWQAPLAVYKAFKRGTYPDYSNDLDGAADILRSLVVRIGAYGDPYAIPVTVWDNTLQHVDAPLGYSHQWKQASKQLMRYCMASVDNEIEAKQANKLGYRYFRTKQFTASKIRKETICPASLDNTTITCADCKACGGLGAKAKANIVIDLHGRGAKHA